MAHTFPSIIKSGIYSQEECTRLLYNTITQKHPKKSFFKALIAAGADINAIDEESNINPLIRATECANLTLMQQLVNEGADIWLSNDAGISGIHVASVMISARIFNFYAERGVDVNYYANGFSRTPIMFAAAYGIQQDISFLMERGADIEAKDMEQDSWRPLRIASHCENVNTVLSLLMHGADTDAVCSFGRTALHSAVHDKNREIIRHLLDHDASVDIADYEGDYPWDLADESIRREFPELYVF